MIYSYLSDLSIPLTRGLNPSNYFGAFNYFGSGWTTCITTICTLSFIYGVTYLIMANIGLFRKFKDIIHWW